MLFSLYFRERLVSLRDAVCTGALWLAINLVMDYPMFAYGPMKMLLGILFANRIGLLGLPGFRVLGRHDAAPVTESSCGSGHDTLENSGFSTTLSAHVFFSRRQYRLEIRTAHRN